MNTYEDLIKLDKELLVEILLKSEQIRRKQAERLEKLEHELGVYEDMYIDQLIANIPD